LGIGCGVYEEEYKEFFAQLITKVCTLPPNSSLVDLVHYTRQGLRQLKQLPKTPLMQAHVDTMPWKLFLHIGSLKKSLDVCLIRTST
jgi:hypothetical protein